MFVKKLLLLSLLFTSSVFAQEPENLSLLKDELVRYHDSGEYAYDISHVIAQARDYLQRRIIDNKKLAEPKRLAIVLDIDETSLSNYALMRDYDFSNSERHGAWGHLDKPTATVITPTRQLYEFAQQHDVAVFFITGRNIDFKNATISNLKQEGYETWTGLYLSPKGYDEHSIANYKIESRKKIADAGYDIVVNIGDQYSDLKGGYADRTYKLPDPFYFVP